MVTLFSANEHTSAEPPPCSPGPGTQTDGHAVQSGETVPCTRRVPARKSGKLPEPELTMGLEILPSRLSSSRALPEAQATVTRTRPQGPQRWSSIGFSARRGLFSPREQARPSQGCHPQPQGGPGSGQCHQKLQSAGATNCKGSPVTHSTADPAGGPQTWCRGWGWGCHTCQI